MCVVLCPTIRLSRNSGFLIQYSVMLVFDFKGNCYIYFGLQLLPVGQGVFRKRLIPLAVSCYKQINEAIVFVGVYHMRPKTQ